MKKLVFLVIVCLALVACKKAEVKVENAVQGQTSTAVQGKVSTAKK
jgi:uncharacterized protein YcfL